MSNEAYRGETASYEHGLPYVGQALIAFADVRNSTALSKRLGPRLFYSQVVHPLYKQFRLAADTLATKFPGWHYHGPKWAGDGALLAYVAPAGQIVRISDFRKFVELLTAWGFIASADTRGKDGPNIAVAIGVRKGDVLVAREPAIISPSGNKSRPVLQEELIGYAVNHAAKLSKGLGDPTARFFWGIRVVAGRGIEERTIRAIAKHRYDWVREGPCLVCKLRLP